jgi:hypothetical protein
VGPFTVFGSAVQTHSLPYVLSLFIAIVLAACASTPPSTDIAAAGPLQWSGTEKRLVLEEPQFDLRENVDSLGPNWTKARADWNETARTIASKSLRETLGERGIVLVHGMAVNEAEYELVLSVQSSYTPPRRKAGDAAAIAGIAGVGVVLPGIPIMFGLVYLAIEAGYCDSICQKINAEHVANGDLPEIPDRATMTLIDRRTGRMIWAHTTKGGEWREEASTKKAIADLLAGSPL